MSARLHYIDWLRVLAVLLLFPFHTWRVFNAGDPFYVKSVYLSQTGGVAERIELALSEPALSAAEKLDAMAEALLEISDEPYEVELMAVFHRPDNLTVHDRVVRSLGERITPHITLIVEQGIAEGVFAPQDPAAAAWFVFGALHGLETGFSGVVETRRAIAQLRAFVLRGLGCSNVTA